MPGPPDDEPNPTAWDGNKEDRSMATAYCVKDKQNVEIKNPQPITMKNGKPATTGTCPICGNSVFRIGAS
jgi:Domain of unknown function (DUF5679)